MRLLLVLFLLANVHFSFGQSGPNKVELIDGKVVMNDISINRNSDIALITNILSKPSRVKRRTEKNFATKEKSKWVDYYYDDYGIKISKAADSGELITMKLSFERITKKDPKGTYTGSIWIDGINFDPSSRESELYKLLSEYSIREVLSLYIVGRNDFTFLMTYKYGGNGVKDFKFAFK